MKLLILLLGRVRIRIVNVVTLFNHKAISARIFDNFLPLGPNLLILDLWSASFNSLHKLLLILSLGQFKSLLNDEIAIVVANESKES